MPLFKIETTEEPQYQNNSNVMKSASIFISEMLGKPEQYVMACVETKKDMMFGGRVDPTAFVTLKSIGLPVDKCSEYSGQICQFIEDQFNVPSDRVFIDFADLKGNMFGWNGKTF